MFERELIDNFKVAVATKTELNLRWADEGFVLDFEPTGAQIAALREVFKPLDMRTLFNAEERNNADPFELIQKQILHYIEVYGLNMPGLFNLEFEGGKVATLNYVRAVDIEELSQLVQRMLYNNAPVKDVAAIKGIVKHFNIAYDLSQVQNNELRVSLFDVDRDRFTNGDDAVRYMCLTATGNSMLIKSPRVIEAVKATKFDPNFFENHLVPLAQVFNRHKRLILAAKNVNTRSVINKITRMSKNLHVPVHEGINKRFISEALSGRLTDFSVLDRISLRDKFKYLNLLEYKLAGRDTDAFLIRNGSVHIEHGRTFKGTVGDIIDVRNAVLKSLEKDIRALGTLRILLDDKVDYGLPISRKQTLGNLPYGTTVNVRDKISAGMFWRNDWGANDLDLSAIDLNGNRTGWGMYSGYDRNNPITFSGDVTSAPNGAMEFMTAAKDVKAFGLFVNIFNGQEGSKMEIVVGDQGEGKWIENPVLREKITLAQRGTIIGFVRNGKYVAYTTGIGGRIISGGTKSEALLAKADIDFWTVRKLLDTFSVPYDTQREEGVEYDVDLSYEGFTYDKLETFLNV